MPYRNHSNEHARKAPVKGVARTPAPAHTSAHTPTLTSVSAGIRRAHTASPREFSAHQVLAQKNLKTLHTNEGTYVEHKWPFHAFSSDSSARARAARVRKTLAHTRLRARSHKVRGTERVSAPSFMRVGLCMLGLILVFCVAGALVHGYLQGLSQTPVPDGDETQIVDSEASIEYKDISYYIREGDGGKRMLASKPVHGTDEDESDLAQLSGLPLALFLYQRTILIPENLDDGSWDVVAFTIGAGGLPTQVVDASGNPVVGTGVLESAELKKDSLLVVDKTGKKTSVSLR